MTTEPDENGFYGTPTDCYVCTEQGPAHEAEVLCERHAKYTGAGTPTWDALAAEMPLPARGADPLPAPSFADA